MTTTGKEKLPKEARSKKAGPWAVLWLGTTHVYLAARSKGEESIRIWGVEWNPDRLELQSPAANLALATHLLALVRKAGVHRRKIRLCLDDSLCVTRVITGDRTTVDRELESVHGRSQLYLSLGLGNKITGSLRLPVDEQSEYALTSIVNQRTTQAIYAATRSAGIQLEGIEPATVSLTRALGYLEVDRSQPILFASIEPGRCDLSLCRDGKLMLSYRISGAGDVQSYASQIVSHFARLKRFCHRYRLQDGSPLQSILILGHQASVAGLTHELQESQDRLAIMNLESPTTFQWTDVADVPLAMELAAWGVLESLERRTDGLPVPNLLPEIVRLQKKPLRERLLHHFWPTGLAASLLLMATGSYWTWSHRLQERTAELSEITVEASLAELELNDWQAKSKLLDNYRELKSQLQEPSWDAFVESIAPCLPGNARLENFTLSGNESISLRGIMIGGDNTYEMVAAIKQLPSIAEVSVESISSLGDASQEKLQFDVKCRLRPWNHSNVLFVKQR